MSSGSPLCPVDGGQSKPSLPYACGEHANTVLIRFLGGNEMLMIFLKMLHLLFMLPSPNKSHTQPNSGPSPGARGASPPRILKAVVLHEDLLLNRSVLILAGFIAYAGGWILPL